MLLGVVGLALACDRVEEKDRPLAPKARSQAIVGEGVTETEAPKTNPAAAEVETPKKPPRKLCDGQMDDPGKNIKLGELSQAVATGESALPEELSLPKGRWTWINFWAAWCAPCKEEIPRLMDFEKRLGKDRMSLVFVTLDDDERQLRQYLESQGAGGLRRTYWLREGKERESWLEGVGMESDPELPVQLLIDPKGKLRCTVQGAVEDSDYERVASLLE
jgi:thiol-disulfide isomerase/thioredoxin